MFDLFINKYKIIQFRTNFILFLNKLKLFLIRNLDLFLTKQISVFQHSYYNNSYILYVKRFARFVKKSCILFLNKNKIKFKNSINKFSNWEKINVKNSLKLKKFHFVFIFQIESLIFFKIISKRMYRDDSKKNILLK